MDPHLCICVCPAISHGPACLRQGSRACDEMCIAESLEQYFATSAIQTPLLAMALRGIGMADHRKSFEDVLPDEEAFFESRMSVVNGRKMKSGHPRRALYDRDGQRLSTALHTCVLTSTRATMQYRPATVLRALCTQNPPLCQLLRVGLRRVRCAARRLACLKACPMMHCAYRPHKHTAHSSHLRACRLARNSDKGISAQGNRERTMRCPSALVCAPKLHRASPQVLLYKRCTRAACSPNPLYVPAGLLFLRLLAHSHDHFYDIKTG